jgi:transposase
MGSPIEITRIDVSATELRELSAVTRDGAVVRRLLAIALVLDGYSREEAAQLSGMDRQTLRDWVHRYNAAGVAGLQSRCSPGRPSALNETQMEELRSLVLQGPDLERNKVIRWRCADLRAEIASRWSVTINERTVGKLLHRLGMTRLQPRPCHPKKEAIAQEDFKKRMARPVRKRFLQSDLSSLRQRIRPMGTALAKMEIRAPRSS